MLKVILGDWTIVFLKKPDSTLYLTFTHFLSLSLTFSLFLSLSLSLLHLCPFFPHIPTRTRQIWPGSRRACSKLRALPADTGHSSRPCWCGAPSSRWWRWPTWSPNRPDACAHAFCLAWGVCGTSNTLGAAISVMWFAWLWCAEQLTLGLPPLRHARTCCILRLALRGNWLYKGWG